MSTSTGNEHNENLDLRENGFVTFRIGDQWLGVPVIMIQEVLSGEEILAVPLSPNEVLGFLNLRGQIVTAVDLRAVLDLPARPEGSPFMNVVVRDGDELFSLVVDSVGDVVEVAESAVEPTPKTLGDIWKQCCRGVIKLDRELLVVLDVDLVLGSGARRAA
jgi:purine-binding chemotaxis protein CheW